MGKSGQWGKLLLAGFIGLLSWGVIGAPAAQAIPTRNELYRSDRLKVAVFKDSQDADIFWYLPPIRLLEDQGKIVNYKRVKGDSVSYYFYVVPYMTDDLIDLLAGELPGLQTKTQLKPIVARQFGIQVKQFNAVSMGEQITDYQYLNSPQLVKVTLPAGDAEEFEFFLNNKPGIQANVLFHYETERMSKYLTIELTYREVYNAMNIGGTGKYRFTKAEISNNIENYVSKKYFNIKGKGDLPIPEIVNKAIEECFTPYKKQQENANKPRRSGMRDWEDWLIEEKHNPQAADELASQEKIASDLEFVAVSPLDDGWDPDTRGDGNSSETSKTKHERLPWEEDDDTDSAPTRRKPNTNSNSNGSGNSNVEIQFTFKKENANSDKAFFYKQEQFVDSSEITAIPTYLSLMPSSASTKVKVTPTVKKDIVVEAVSSKVKPFGSGIQIKQGEQYVITAAFALAARSVYYDGDLNWIRWQSTWPSTDEDLYYRVGSGPWNKVNGRAVIKTEGIYHGELQFYIDREKIWSKIPSKYKDSKMLGLVPQIFKYQYTYPQYNVIVNGRKIDLN